MICSRLGMRVRGNETMVLEYDEELRMHDWYRRRNRHNDLGRMLMNEDLFHSAIVNEHST